MRPGVYRGGIERRRSIPASGWNPLDKNANVTLSVGNTVATIVSPGTITGAVRGIQSRLITDNRFFEVIVNGTDAIELAGIGTSAASLASFPGVDALSRGFYPIDNVAYYNGAHGTSYFNIGTAFTIGVAYDATHGIIYLIANGKLPSPIATGISGTLFPMWGPASTSAAIRHGTLNTGGSAFVYAPPIGASAWDPTATWNPADKGTNVTLTGGNLIATVLTGGGSVRATTGHSTGFFYFEITYSGADNVNTAGIGNSSAPLTTYPGFDTNAWAYYFNDGQFYNHNFGKPLPPPIIATIGVWLNSGVIQYVMNNQIGAATSPVLSGGPYFPMWGPGTSSATSGRTGTINTGGPFVNTVPSGASAWG